VKSGRVMGDLHARHCSVEFRSFSTVSTRPCPPPWLCT
jgi:hypothetical protein